MAFLQERYKGDIIEVFMHTCNLRKRVQSNSPQGFLFDPNFYSRKENVVEIFTSA